MSHWDGLPGTGEHALSGFQAAVNGALDALLSGAPPPAKR
jgi:hypothetical protein